MAFLGATGVVGFIIGIVLIIFGKIKKKKYYGGLITIVSFILFITAIALTPTNDERDTAKPASEPAKEEVNADISWQDKVKEAAAMDGTETEKADTIEVYARDYQVTNDELKEFEDYIINEYKTGNYIKDISDHEYMLTNIFKSVVVERAITDDNDPIKNFAFDFYQNCKYNYRGVDTPTSTATIANERQMDKALEQME